MQKLVAVTCDKVTTYNDNHRLIRSEVQSTEKHLSGVIICWISYC